MTALMHRLTFFLGAAALLGSLAATVHAQPAASVEAVQMPAWVVRSEGGAPARRMPLLPGMELRAGDQIFTGAGSRALVRLAEGSVVKLGENGTLRFTKIDRSTEIFRAALGVLQGAFRFTTELIGQGRRREVEIRVATVTAGIRGTDLWGRGRKDNEVVCLIEGEIQVGAEGEAAQTLNQPLQFYRRVDAKTQPIGFIDTKQLGEWAKETEIEAGKGALRAGGSCRRGRW